VPGIIELNAGTVGATSALVSGRGKHAVRLAVAATQARSAPNRRQLKASGYHALDRDVFIDTFPTQSRAADLQPYLGQFRLTGLP